MRQGLGAMEAPARLVVYRKSEMRIAVLVLSIAMGLSSSATSAEDHRPAQSLLRERCLECHGPDKQRSGLRLDRKELAFKGGDATEKTIVPGKPEQSLLLQMVTSGRDGKIMPPKGPRLTPKEVEGLKQWILAGAPWIENQAVAKHSHWSFNPPTRPLFPKVKNATWVRNGIDSFIASKLEATGLEPQIQSERPALLRRLSIDLTGLPPTPEEYDAFNNDRSNLAYEKQVDRLLASPRFGERWARHWLDLARYADSRGFGSDPLRLNAWPWRDWVIDAFNRNLPFDQFSIEQLAGDLLANPSDDQILATGFHRNTMTNTEGGTDDEEFRVAAIKDRVDSTAQIWMGLTLGCAKCHSHKFDPISMKEYYSFFAIFNQTADSDKGDEFPTKAIAPLWQRPGLELANGKIAELKKQIAQTNVGDEAREWETNLGLELPPLPLTTSPAQEPNTLLVNQPGEKLEAIEVRVNAGLKLASPPAAARILPGATGKPPSTPVAAIVRVEVPGAMKILSLAEVQVFSQGKNVTAGGKATQSSTAFDGPAQLAIDGNTNGDYQAKSTTHTNTESNPWWEVRLSTASSVEKIALWSRTDGALFSRMEGFKISLMDEKRNVLWSQEKQAAPPISKEWAPSASSEIRDRALYVRNGAYVFLFPNNVKSLQAPFRLQLLNEKNQVLDPTGIEIKKSAGNWTAFQTLSPEAQKVLLLPSSTRSKEQVGQLTSFFQTQSPKLKPLRDELARLEKAKPAVTPVAIMEELPKAKGRKTHLLVKGNFLTPGVEVQPGLPALFPSRIEKEPTRLDLARWIVSKDNPVTARVEVNRLWALIFGNGLVETEEDFGTMGQPPSNAELLDWLAVEFVQTGWDIKAFFKLIVTSATYMQSAKTTPLALKLDPKNILLSRSPRSRLDAEQIRDQALALGGLLSSKMYGPSVYPPQPPNLWQAAFNGERAWNTSMGEDKVRRGIYTFWRRTVPYPSMQTFDAPSREFCTIRRINTNTPLQAFVTLNDPVFVEAAQGMALRVLNEGGGSTELRLNYAWKLTTGFSLAPEQALPLRDLVEFSMKKFQGNEEEAKKLAPVPAEYPRLSQQELAAWTVVCNILLNLDQVVTRS